MVRSRIGIVTMVTSTSKAMNLALYEQRIAQGASPWVIVAHLVEGGELIPASSSRRQMLKTVAGGAAQASVTRALVPSLATAVVQQAVQSAVAPRTPAIKPKEVVPEFKGQALAPHVAASAAHNAYQRDHGLPASSPEDFSTDTHATFMRQRSQYTGYNPKTGKEEYEKWEEPVHYEHNPEGHPINTKAYEYYDGEYQPKGSSMQAITRIVQRRRAQGKTTVSDEYDEARLEAAKDWNDHGHLLHAKVGNGAIAYENPFHERFKDNLDPSVKAVHVNHSTGEVTKFKVPLNFDDHGARNFGIRRLSRTPSIVGAQKDESHEWIHQNVVQHYNTRVAPGANIDTSVHKRFLKAHGFDDHSWGSDTSKRFTKEYSSKNWEHDALPHDVGDKIKFLHPETGKETHGVISDVHPESGHVTIEHAPPGRHMDTEEYAFTKVPTHAITHNEDGPAVVTRADGSTYQRERYSAPQRLKHHLEVHVHPTGWTVSHRPGYTTFSHLHSQNWQSHPKQDIASGQSAEELRDFMGSWEKDHE